MSTTRPTTLRAWPDTSTPRPRLRALPGAGLADAVEEERVRPRQPGAPRPGLERLPGLFARLGHRSRQNSANRLCRKRAIRRLGALCQVVPGCARSCQVVTKPIAHCIAHSPIRGTRTREKPHFRGRIRAKRVVGPAGLEHRAYGCARSCHVVSGCVYECHTRELVAPRTPVGCARSCQVVPRCDQTHCTLHCTLVPRGHRASMRPGGAASSPRAGISLMFVAGRGLMSAAP